MLALLIVGGVALSAPASAMDDSARDFQRDYPAGCSPDQARSTFVRVVRELRVEHRAAIKHLADEFARELNSGERASGKDETPETLGAARKLLAALRAACDAQTALQVTFLYRSRLSSIHQKHTMVIAERLSALVEELGRAKLAYQPFLAAKLRGRWELLNQSEKRELLEEYFALAGAAPEWLLRQGGNARLPLARSTADMLQSFERRGQDRLRAAEKALQPQRDALAAKVRAAREAAGATDEERQALKSMHELLEADYGKGFRGMMLLEPDVNLPAGLQDDVTALCKTYRTELARLRSERTSQFAEFQQVLAPLRKAHLDKEEFAELMAIDIRLHELKELLQPLRILAYREPGIEWAEDVLLLDVRDSEYRVRFLRDQHEAWLKREQVLLKPSETTIRTELAVPTPADGPGSPVTARTALQEGQTLMGYRNKNWYPVTVVDVSPFGVVINWQGFGESSTQVEPRSRLRMLND